MPWVRETPQTMRPERPRELSIPLGSIMLTLVADVGPNVLDLRLAHRERPNPACQKNFAN
jgi:hypothetical protein